MECGSIGCGELLTGKLGCQSHSAEYNDLRFELEWYVFLFGCNWQLKLMEGSGRGVSSSITQFVHYVDY